MALAVFYWFFEVLKRHPCVICYMKVRKVLVKEIFPTQHKTYFLSQLSVGTHVSLAEILGQDLRESFFLS